ncbi:MAG TPA: hypothetical protein VF021_09455, partial [Longimicrobiales bacterium]
EMLLLADAARSREEGYQAAARALADGRALEKFRAIIEAQGGNPAVIDDPALLPQAPVRRVLAAERDGYIGEMQVREIGEAAVALGAGRASLESEIDPAVGFYMTAKPGQKVTRGEALVSVFARTEAKAEEALVALRRAVPVTDAPFQARPLISHRVTSKGVEELT